VTLYDAINMQSKPNFLHGLCPYMFNNIWGEKACLFSALTEFKIFDTVDVLMTTVYRNYRIITLSVLLGIQKRQVILKICILNFCRPIAVNN
jgi:hypothetical protein